MKQIKQIATLIKVSFKFSLGLFTGIIKFIFDILSVETDYKEEKTFLELDDDSFYESPSYKDMPGNVYYYQDKHNN